MANQRAFHSSPSARKGNVQEKASFSQKKARELPSSKTMYAFSSEQMILQNAHVLLKCVPLEGESCMRESSLFAKKGQ
jgi:hypothetical protein